MKAPAKKPAKPARPAPKTDSPKRSRVEFGMVPLDADEPDSGQPSPVDELDSLVNPGNPGMKKTKSVRIITLLRENDFLHRYGVLLFMTTEEVTVRWRGQNHIFCRKTGLVMESPSGVMGGFTLHPFIHSKDGIFRRPAVPAMPPSPKLD